MLCLNCPQTVEELVKKRDDINAKRPQCPVGLMTIRFPSSQVNQKVFCNLHSYLHSLYVEGWLSRLILAVIYDQNKKDLCLEW